MTYATHKAGGAAFALGGFIFLSSKGLLTSDISPWLSLFLMYPASSFGSTLPDLDHGWSNVKEHTPANWLIHKIIHITKPKHRSWQTHCLVLEIIKIIVLFLLLTLCKTNEWFSQTSLSILYLIVTGFSLGIASHLFLDMFTRAGIHLIPGRKIRFVPNNEKFSCSSDSLYETIWRVFLYMICLGLLIWILIL